VAVAATPVTEAEAEAETELYSATDPVETEAEAVDNAATDISSAPTSGVSSAYRALRTVAARAATSADCEIGRERKKWRGERCINYSI
jgi:hypothetical protein